MAILTSFDANAFPVGDPLEPVPNGRYQVMIIDSQWKVTKAGDGHYLQLCLQVTEGKYSGRMLWLRLNLDSPDPVVVDLAANTLACVCRAVGVPKFDDPSELHDRPFSVRVSRKFRPGSRESFNKIERISGLSNYSV
jgi:hypothetical protein